MTELLDLSSDLVVQAARLVRAVRARSEASGAGVRVLSVLDEHGPLSITRLARIDRCAQPTMSGAVASLEKRGWVTKSPDPDDARAQVVTLTAEGSAELRRVRQTNAETVAAIVEAHPTHNTEDLATAVRVLRDILTEFPEGPQ